MIFLISGKQGAGKTTLCNALVAKLSAKGYNPYALKFAEPLYKMHDAVLGILSDYGVTRDIVKDGPLLQLLGTNWGRNTIAGDLWANLIKNKVDKLFEINRRDSVLFVKPLAIIIDDARFENELDAFPDAYKIRLECDRDVRKARCSMWRHDELHPSETGLDEYSNRDFNYFDCYADTEDGDPEAFAAQIVEDAERIRNENK